MNTRLSRPSQCILRRHTLLHNTGVGLALPLLEAMRPAIARAAEALQADLERQDPRSRILPAAREWLHRLGIYAVRRWDEINVPANPLAFITNYPSFFEDILAKDAGSKVYQA